MFSTEAEKLEAELKLSPVELPVELSYIFDLYNGMSARRGPGNGFGGMAAITWPEFEAWMRVTKQKLTQFEIEMLSAVERAFLEGQPSNKPEELGGEENHG